MNILIIFFCIKYVKIIKNKLYKKIKYKICTHIFLQKKKYKIG